MLKKSILLILPAQNFSEAGFLALKSCFEKDGLSVLTASDSNSLCTGESGAMKIKADMNFYNIHESNFSALVFAGGNGAREYWNNATLHRIAKKFFEAKKTLAAISSAPVILSKAGLLTNLTATCLPEDKKELERSGAQYTDHSVVVKKKIITARDEKSAFEFAKCILDALSN
jgi:protease I